MGNPFTFNWNTAGLNGSHTVSARAYDGAGNVSPTATITLNVSNPASSGINLALNKLAVASSVQAPEFQPTLAVDGSMTTRWASQYADPQWICVNLGATNKVDSILLNWESAYAAAYDVQVSTDSANWTSVYSTSTNSGGMNNIKILPVDARWVKVIGSRRGTAWGYSLWEFSVFKAGSGVLDVPPNQLPLGYQLQQNHPNPFNPTTSIRYSLPLAAKVTLNVFNTLGQVVATLVDAVQDAGSYDVQFDGSNVTSGVYYYRIVAGDFSATKKMLLMK
jgi:hypothetical protein